MAPNSRNTANGYQANGFNDGDYEPPLSTMAVQLISNITTTNGPSLQPHSDSDSELGRLMNEISELERSIEAGFELESPVKLAHKHKLIYVLICTVLEKLAKDDPFLALERALGHTSDALDVFISTVQDCPEVLGYVVPDGVRFSGRGSEPLWVWMFPKILTLLERSRCAILTEKIKEFFRVSFQAVSRSTKLWNLSSSFFGYLKESVSTTLLGLESPGIISLGSAVEIVLPSDQATTAFSLSGNSGNTPFNCNYVIRDAAQGLCHASQILSVLVDVSMTAATEFDATPAFEDYLGWMFDAILEIHELLRRWHANPSLYQSCSKLPMAVLLGAQTLLKSLRASLSPSFLRKGYGILTLIYADMIEDPTELPETILLIAICSGFLYLAYMCQKHDSVSRTVAIHLVPALEKIFADEAAISNVGKDFRRAAIILCKACQIDVLLENELGADAMDIDSGPNPNDPAGFENEALRKDFVSLGISFESEEPTNDPPAKRRRTGKLFDHVNKLVEDFPTDFCPFVPTDMDPGFSGMSAGFAERFAAASDADRCKAIEGLGRLSCAGSGNLTIVFEDRKTRNKIKDWSCVICDEIPLANRLDANQRFFEDLSHQVIDSFTSLINSHAFLDSRKPRVLAMIALRRLATHFDSPTFRDLDVSSLAQWCLRSLTSSVRELRIAASRTLPAFLKGEQKDLLATKNKMNTFEVLRTFPSGQGTHLQETCVLAWGQIGRIAKDEDLNLVLWNLIQYLGHSNPIISGAAFNEITRLAQALNLTVERLFSPFWGNLAGEVVKGLLVKPQTTQLMAELLGMSVTQFLTQTQSYTIPWLVLGQQTDVIKRISQAREDKETWLACLEPSNLVPTLALLMVQGVPDIEIFIMSLFKKVSSRFKDITLDDLMRVEPASQALHLLKAAGEATDDKKGRIRLALQFLAERAPTPAHGTRRKGNPVGLFLEQHILGLVASISEVAIDSRFDHPMIEKERCIKAIEELVKVAKSHTRVARPQICACLQAALKQKGLQASAFSAWQTMLVNLEDEDVESMLESTFSTVIQHWESFDATTQDRAERTLQYLLKDRARLVRNTIVNLPSLSQIPQLKVAEQRLMQFRTKTDVGNVFQIFSRRLGHENSGVVVQALVELKSYLRDHQSFLQASAMSEQPDVVIGILVRAILDTCVKFNESNKDVAQLSAECIGLIGCLDPNRVESVREQREVVVVSNFMDPSEATDFTLFLLEQVLVPAFLSSTDAVLQGFFSFVIQELLDRCDFRNVCGGIIRDGDRGSDNDIWLKWCKLHPSVQDTLTPFLSSKYSLKEMDYAKCEYPIFRPEKMPSAKSFNNWLRSFVLDLLRKGHGWAAPLIFTPLCRAIRIKDISIARFLLPYLVLHVIASDNEIQRDEVAQELLAVLKYEPTPDANIRREDLKLYIEMVFRVLDYLARWVQERQVKSRGALDEEVVKVASVLAIIPSEIIADRAVECKSYSRALFYWEQHIRQVRVRDVSSETNTKLLERLQDIYAQIDEPDGIEGISAHLHVLDIEQQVLGHRRAGRWTAAQSWYEIKLAEKPDDVDVQLNLLTCLKESGQHDVLLNYVEGMHTAAKTIPKLLPFAAEASWATGRWQALEKFTAMAAQTTSEDFNVNIGRSLLALHKKRTDEFQNTIKTVREQIARSLSTATTASLSACHDNMLKLHVLAELEMIAGTDLDSHRHEAAETNRGRVLETLNNRLEVLGAYLNDKQYILGIRRAAMQISSLPFQKVDIASSWLTSARLARKGNAVHQSFNAVLHASQLGDASATIEHARLLWKEGHHRKAVQNLRGAIDSNAFISYNKTDQSTSFTGAERPEQQNLLTARAHLLLAKWLDSAGQSQSSTLRMQYQLAAKTHQNWEKGHYYLGRHYNKLLESEKAMPPDQHSQAYVTGDMAKLVVENYLRSLLHGTKYIYQTLPRLLTLWLDLGNQVLQPIDPKLGINKDVIAYRVKCLEHIHSRFEKYIAKLPAYMFYTALPQIVARITHQNPEVFHILGKIIYKVVDAHPQQALWTLLAVAQSGQMDRKTRGISIIQQFRGAGKKNSAIDFKALLKNGERITNDLLHLCTAGEFHGNRTQYASLSKELSFNQKNCLPSPMAVPVESVLTATLPTLTDSVKDHKAFSRDVVTITAFEDEVMIMSSLQKPRKVTARGSDGRKYGLMCKPKDDLRKDQRLMEFNSMINRSLKRDAESSRRQLYIKTYSVTPLNEECGIIEWVDGLKTLRDILLALYKAKGISPNYRELEVLCDEATKSDTKISFFTEKVLGSFPSVFHLWFIQQFPEPSAWFAARLRYTRSCAVMSMVGTILGLGDRHGENILFEEGNGGTFHVDFNCLFEKGLTFAKPERVPFRLTHNMVDAMGVYGFEGPFRKSSELTLSLLRQHEETLMTILEAFVYDPTLDLLMPKTKKKQSTMVAQTPQGVLDTINRKVKGLLAGESVPLGVEGQVDELIKEATNPTFLAGMYVGWCSFF